MERVDLYPRGLNEKSDERRETATGLSPWRALGVYKVALFWSAFMGIAGINWGQDMLLSTGVVTTPSFEEAFGHIVDGSYTITTSWQVAFNTVSSAGSFLGAIATGYLSDKFGKRKTLGLACVMSIGSVLVQLFATRSAVLIFGKLVNGLCLGCFISVPTAYAAEINPVELRGLATSSMQLFLGLGQLISSVVLKHTGTMDSPWAYKIPFASQFIFPVILLIGLPFAPESPWFLIRANKPVEALKSLSRLGYPSPNETLSEVVETILHEDTESSKVTYLDCFRGSDLRRTEIAMGIMAVSQLTGVVFVVGYSTYFFQLAGISTSASQSLSIGVTSLGLLGVVGSWLLIDRVGRRATALAGVSICTFLLFLIGIFDVIASSSTMFIYGQVACVIVFAFVYLLTIGPMSYALLSEISSTRLRSLTIGLSIVVQSIFGIVLNIVIPLMMSPTAANLKGKIGFIFGATALASVAWVSARVPETKGRGFRELDSLFEMGVSASRFTEYRIT